MPFLTLTNNQRISEIQTFILIPALALNQSRMTHKAVGVCKWESPSPRWIVKAAVELHLTRNKFVFWRQMLAMHTSVICYYHDRHEKPGRRSLSKRGYQVSLTVWSMSWSKGYSTLPLTPVIPDPFEYKMF